MPSDPAYRFDGFREPRYTPIPDEFLDDVAPNLTEAELRVALYVLRRTFGFKKQADAISLSQMSEGIRTKDGKILDHGTGMSRSAVWRGAKGLVEKGVLTVQKRLSRDGDNETNVYQLRFAPEGVVLLENHGNSLAEPGVALLQNPQETVEQETGKQDFEISNGRSPHFADDDRLREALLPFAEDFGRELSDQAPLTSTLSRLVNLYQRSGCDLNDYIDLVYRARRITKERSAAIRGTAETTRGKAKMGYFFAILEDQLGVRAAGAGAAPPE
jgi:hypothetical protein